MSENNYWMSNLQERNCPLCGSNNHHIISSMMQYNLNLNTVICKTCGFVFTNPIPEKSIYDSFYSTAYSDFYGHLTPRSIADNNKRVPEFIKEKVKWISEIELMTGKRILEIGPGKGFFLSYAKQCGNEVLGIEPSHTFFDILQEDKIPCVYGSLDQFNKDELGQFDVVVMFHVLEHFYNPNEALTQAWNFLKDSGLLILEVPNILKPFRSLDHYFLRYVHLSCFSPHTLDNFLKKHNFDPIFYNEGDTGWRAPNSVFVIAQKKKKNINNEIVPENWTDIILQLKNYRRTWRYWGKYRWAFYFEYVQIRRLYFRLGRFVKNHFLGVNY